jgi:PPOX class probable F420-dependent enzyme
VNLPPRLVELLKRPSLCFIATNMPDGSPQLTQTWVDGNEEYVVINTVQSHQKVRNIKRDPRVALNICDPDHPSAYVGIRGRVIAMTTEGAVEHIDVLAQRYLGRPYPWWGGRDQVRLMLTIEADKISGTA